MSSSSTVEYLNLSALAYGEFDESATGRSVGYVLDNGLYKKIDIDSPELHLLKESSSPLRSWTIIAQSPIFTANVFTQNGYTRKLVAGNDFSAIALKNPETGEIVFAFRGTNSMGDWDTDVAIAGGVHHLLVDQFARAKSFVFDVMNKFGPICYENQEQMFKDIGERGGVSFTGHSLGGALAQYIYHWVRYLFYKHPTYGML